MSSPLMKSEPALMSHLLKSERLVLEFQITSHATPASKIHSSDIAHVVYLRSEGKIAEADAIEDLSASFTTAVDNSTGNSVFGVLLTRLESIEKVYSISVTEQTSLAASIATTKLGTNGLTSGGNIAFEIAGTGLNLASESPTFRVEIEYRLSI